MEKPFNHGSNKYGQKKYRAYTNMRDTTYFRQIPKYTIESSAQTNHLRHESCILENCIAPMTPETVQTICRQDYSAEQCTRIADACNDACLPVTIGCATTEVDGTACIDHYSYFNKKS